jgi:hypothetical protein
LETTIKAFFQVAMNHSAEKIRAASPRTERRIELLPAAQFMR